MHICYFFFSFRGSERGDLSSLLRSLLYQLSANDNVPTCVVELYMRCHQTFPPRSPTLIQLQEVMGQVLTEVLESSPVYLVIDALDEVMWENSREELLTFVGQLPAQATAQLRILVSSRNETDIRDEFGQSDSVWKDLPVSPKDVDQDIERYINKGINKYPVLKRQNHATKALIREKLIEKANGMYVNP